MFIPYPVPSGLQNLGASTDVVKLAVAIMTYEGKSGDSFVDLDVKWPPRASSKLYIRHFYEPLIDRVFKHLTPRNEDDLICH